MAIGVGIASGNFLFKEPLREHFEKQQQQQREEEERRRRHHGLEEQERGER